MRRLLLTSLLLVMTCACKAQDFQFTFQEELEHVIPSDLPNSIEIEGLFKDGVSFQDKDGEHFVVFSELWNRGHSRNSLYLRQFTRLKGTVREKWDFRIGPTKNCPIEFIPNSFRAIDLDGDGVMEISFVISRDCPDSTGLHELVLFSQGRQYTAKAFTNPLPDVARNLITFDANLRNGYPGFQWFLKEEWRNFVEENRIGGMWAWEIEQPQLRLLRWEEKGKSPKKRYTWIGEDGTPAYLPDEMLPLIRNARAFHFLPQSASLLLLHGDAIGTVDPATKQFTVWRSFEGGDLLLSDWAWSPSQNRFAFTLLNTRKYLNQTAIVTMDVKEGALGESYDHQVPVAYQITDVARGYPLIFHDERHVEFTAHPPETPSTKREQWLLDTLPEE